MGRNEVGDQDGEDSLRCLMAGEHLPQIEMKSAGSTKETFMSTRCRVDKLNSPCNAVAVSGVER
jgi:hypothetical protein